jgi:hypothetical protein
MTEEELAAIEADHQSDYCQKDPICFAIRLVNEVRRLRTQVRDLSLNGPPSIFDLLEQAGGPPAPWSKRPS